MKMIPYMTWRRGNKYNAVPVFKHGRRWSSKLELAVYETLLRRVESSELRDLETQQTVVLQQGGKVVTGDGITRQIRISWRVDFKAVIVATGEDLYIEAKGKETDEYIMKLKMWIKNPPAKLEIYKGSHIFHKITETIYPKEKE